ncbi:MAG: DUF2851 family protein [Ignavibacteriales bacterium]|nr:DUF2851 family protein [Ignavibacteriales bacterium]
MANQPTYFEQKLYKIWNEQNFNSPLETSDEQKIEVISKGELDTDSGGPDIKNAKIRIGSLTFVGDVEIDSNYNDWINHKHNLNSKYNRVILHVTLFNNSNHNYVYTKDGRKIPTLSLSKFIDEDKLNLLKSKGNTQQNKSNKNINCSGLNKEVSIEIKEKFIAELSIKRFNKKCARIYSRLKELSYLRQNNMQEPKITYELSEAFYDKIFSIEDFKYKEIWQQTLYEFVFQALGYSNNKDMMLKLAQSFNIDYIKKIIKLENPIAKLESAFFNISGLSKEPAKQDDDVRKYLIELAKNYDEIKDIYDGEFFKESDWNFFKQRPTNFPTIRIAGGVRFIYDMINKNLISLLIQKATEINRPNILLNSFKIYFIIQTSGFWKNHYNFGSRQNEPIKYFIGAYRADEIIINVVLPFLSIYFDLFNLPEISKKILKCYNLHEQNSDNKISKLISDELGLKEHCHKTLYMQGMLELYHSFCIKNNCTNCEIGKIAFK